MATAVSNWKLAQLSNRIGFIEGKYVEVLIDVCSARLRSIELR